MFRESLLCPQNFGSHHFDLTKRSQEDVRSKIKINYLSLYRFRFNHTNLLIV